MVDYNIQNLTILVVEQNCLSAEAITKLLHELGVRDVFSASSVDDAFDIFENETIDLVFCDWSPSLDGIRFLDMIRNDEKRTNPYLPVILLSAYSDLEQLKEAINAGISDFVTKPYSARRLYTRIKKAIELPNFYVRSGLYFGPCRRHNSEGRRSARDNLIAPYDGQERRIRAIAIADEPYDYATAQRSPV